MTPENALEHALLAAATELEARTTFYRLMLESPLYTVDDNPEAAQHEGLQTLAAGVRLHIPTFEIAGVAHTPIFSSLVRLQAAIDSERRYVSMNGRALLELVQGSHLILNPGSPYGKQFLPDEVDAMLNGEIFRGYSTQTLQEATRVLLGQPATRPDHLLDALVQLFRGMADVKAAYLAHVAFPETGDPPHTMIGVDARGDWQAIVRQIMQTIRETAQEGEVVDVIQIDGADISSYMLNETKPFYKRKRFGLF